MTLHRLRSGERKGLRTSGMDLALSWSKARGGLDRIFDGGAAIRAAFPAVPRGTRERREIEWLGDAQRLPLQVGGPP
jgi:hypothetical protein